MTLVHWTAKGLLHHSRRRLVWRSLLAAPFALSLVLALILGPATVDNPHSSFGSLVAWSLVAALGFFIVSDGLLIAAGFLALVVFPLHVGLGFHFAPSWAEPIVVVVFYGSIAASLAAVGNGLAALVPPLVRTHPRTAAIAAGGVALRSVGAIESASRRISRRSTGSTETAPGSVPSMSASRRLSSTGCWRDRTSLLPSGLVLALSRVDGETVVTTRASHQTMPCHSSGQSRTMKPIRSTSI